jgi:hypothetical protein
MTEVKTDAKYRIHHYKDVILQKTITQSLSHLTTVQIFSTCLILILQEMEIPENLRQRDHVAQILRLDSESLEKEMILAKTVDATLKELKRVYDNAIKPLEMLFKYRELSNRHFGGTSLSDDSISVFKCTNAIYCTHHFTMLKYRRNRHTFSIV